MAVVKNIAAGVIAAIIVVAVAVAPAVVVAVAASAAVVVAAITMGADIVPTIDNFDINKFQTTPIQAEGYCHSLGAVQAMRKVSTPCGRIAKRLGKCGLYWFVVLDGLLFVWCVVCCSPSF